MGSASRGTIERRCAVGDIFRKGQGGSFYIRWYEEGRRRILSTKQSSYADARRLLLEIEARVARGDLGMREHAASGLTVAELIERFVEEYDRPRVKDARRYRQQARSVLRRVLPTLGAQKVGQVKLADIARLRSALGRKWAPGSVKLTLNILSSMLSWAVQKGLAADNPCRGVERPTAPHSLDFLSPEEVNRLLDAAEAGTAEGVFGRMRHLAIAVALHTGLRKGEILGLRWVDLDLNAQRLTVARSYRGAPKSGKARHLRIPAALLPLLRDWHNHCPRSPSGAVFPLGRRPDGVASCGAMLGLPRLMSMASLRAFPHPWHVLRHTFASHYMMAGGNLLALKQILGHTDIKVTMIYAHLSPSFLDGEMDRVSFPKRAPN